VSLTALFLLGLAVAARADVAQVGPIDVLDVRVMNFGSANAMMRLAASRPRAGVAESGCIGVYSAMSNTLVYHAVCQDVSAADGGKVFADFAQRPGFMLSSTPQRFVAFKSGRLSESESWFDTYGAGETRMGARWRFDVLDRIAASQAAIEAATALLPGARSGDEADVGHHSELQDQDSPHPGEDKDHDDDRAPAVVPEPATLLLVGTGICVLGRLRRRLTIA